MASSQSGKQNAYLSKSARPCHHPWPQQKPQNMNRDEGDEGDESKDKKDLFLSLSPSSLLNRFSFAFSSPRGGIYQRRLIGSSPASYHPSCGFLRQFAEVSLSLECRERARRERFRGFVKNQTLYETARAASARDLSPPRDAQ
jgi:hypothetical protein